MTYKEFKEKIEGLGLEIEQIKEKYNVTLGDWELVEVQE